MVGSVPLSRPSTPGGRIFLPVLFILAFFSSCSWALNHIAGGPCESVCADSVAGTVHDDVRCLDDQFSAAPASHVKNCVTCQLNSTAVDPVTQVTDVEWALFNLRYVLSNCMFAYPEERVSISSPCQVSCAPLKTAVTFAIPNSTNATNFSANLGFCTSGQFDDFTLNNCAFCYSFIPQQLVLGNFLQALHIACHSPPAVGKSFYPDGARIFNQSTIAGPTGAVTAPAHHGLTGGSLVLAIVLPIVGGIIILLGLCFCCWHFTRKRRARMAASGRMSRFQDGQIQEYSPMSPTASPPQQMYTPAQQYPAPQQDMWNQHPTEMTSISDAAKTSRVQITAMPPIEQQTARSSPAVRSAPSPVPDRWAGHTREESSTPLTSSEQNGLGQGENIGTTVNEVKDPNLHDQFIAGQNRGSPAIDTFRAQDGFVKEHAQGGKTQ